MAALRERPFALRRSHFGFFVYSASKFRSSRVPPFSLLFLYIEWRLEGKDGREIEGSGICTMLRRKQEKKHGDGGGILFASVRQMDPETHSRLELVREKVRK